eukprot:scaffold60193_cov63-Phaeocystis_antarctica.AAC.1
MVCVIRDFKTRATEGLYHKKTKVTALKRSLRSSPLGPAVGALLLLDDDLDLDECVWRHGRNHALLLDAWRRRRCSLLRRRLSLRRPRDAERRLLSGGEVAQAKLLATAPHPRLVGLGVSPSACACCRASSLVSGAAAAARSAATACPSGDRVTLSAASSAVAKAWVGRGWRGGSLQSSPSYYRTRAASAPPPAPVAVPPRSSAASPLQPAPPLPPAPPAIARRTAPPPRRRRSGPDPLSRRRASSAPDRACAGRAWRGSRHSSPPCYRPRAASAPPPAPAAAPPRSSAAPPLQRFAPPPALPAYARRTAPPPRRAWGIWAGGRRRSSPCCCRPPAALASPPAPAAAPPRSSAVAPLQPAPPLSPAPPATARRTVPPPQRWRSCPGALVCHRATPAAGRAWACRAGGRRQSSDQRQPLRLRLRAPHHGVQRSPMRRDRRQFHTGV